MSRLDTEGMVTSLELTLAQILSLAHWVILYLGLHRGLGKAPSLLGDDIINDIGRVSHPRSPLNTSSADRNSSSSPPAYSF